MKEGEVYFNVKVNVTHYSPYRPAPFCSNPDSPNFADSGDDEELEYDAFVVVYKTEYNSKTQKVESVKVNEFPLPDEMYEALQEQLDELALEEAREGVVDAEEAAAEAKYEAMKDDGLI